MEKQSFLFSQPLILSYLLPSPHLFQHMHSVPPEKPFWPKGTGCGQGFLSAMDTAWMIQGLGEGRHIIELLSERESVYQLLAQTTPEKLQQSVDKYTIDPTTRYTNLNMQQVKPNDVIRLYDTGSEPMPKYEPRPHRALAKTKSAPSACKPIYLAYSVLCILITIKVPWHWYHGFQVVCFKTFYFRNNVSFFGPIVCPIMRQ